VNADRRIEHRIGRRTTRVQCHDEVGAFGPRYRIPDVGSTNLDVGVRAESRGGITCERGMCFVPFDDDHASRTREFSREEADAPLATRRIDHDGIGPQTWKQGEQSREFDNLLFVFATQSNAFGDEKKAVKCRANFGGRDRHARHHRLHPATMPVFGQAQVRGVLLRRR
jgi:hypothetical protein